MVVVVINGIRIMATVIVCLLLFSDNTGINTKPNKSNSGKFK